MLLNGNLNNEEKEEHPIVERKDHGKKRFKKKIWKNQEKVEDKIPATNL